MENKLLLFCSWSERHHLLSYSAGKNSVPEWDFTCGPFPVGRNRRYAFPAIRGSSSAHQSALDPVNSDNAPV